MKHLAYTFYLCGEVTIFYTLLGIRGVLSPIMEVCLIGAERLCERAEKRQHDSLYYLLLLVRGWLFMSGIHLFLFLCKTEIARERIIGHEGCIAEIERERDKIREQIKAASRRPEDG